MMAKRITRRCEVSWHMDHRCYERRPISHTHHRQSRRWLCVMSTLTKRNARSST